MLSRRKLPLPENRWQVRENNLHTYLLRENYENLPLSLVDTDPSLPDCNSARISLSVRKTVLSWPLTGVVAYNDTVIYGELQMGNRCATYQYRSAKISKNQDVFYLNLRCKIFQSDFL